MTRSIIYSRSPAILHLSLSASKFEDSVTTGMASISDMFRKVAQRQSDPTAGTSHQQPTSTTDHQQNTSITDHQPIRTSGNQLDKAFTAVSVDGALADAEQSPDPTSRPMSLKAYFTDELHTATPKLGDQSCAGGFQKAVSDNTHTKTTAINTDIKPGNSFFKKYLLQKKLASDADNLSASAKVSSRSEDHAVITKSSVSKLSLSEDNSCDAAIDALVDLLEVSDNEDVKNVTQELEQKPIKLSLTPKKSKEESPPASVYDTSTDDDVDVDKDVQTKEICSDKSSIQGPLCSTPKSIPREKLIELKSRAMQGPEKRDVNVGAPSNMVSPTTNASMSTISVCELFPDISAVDESLLPHLPFDLRRAVKAAVATYEAERSGKNALKKTGMWKYMTKENCIDPRKVNVDTKQVKISFTKSSLGRQNGHVDKPVPVNVKHETGIKKYLKNDSSSGTPELTKLPTAGQPILTIDISSRSKEKISIQGREPDASINPSDNSAECEDNIPGCSTDDVIQCDRCREMISIESVAEHLDYHVALDLQENLAPGNSNTSGCHSSGNTQSRANNKAKRKLSKQHPQNKRNKRIESFFTK